MCAWIFLHALIKSQIKNSTHSSQKNMGRSSLVFLRRFLNSYRAGKQQTVGSLAPVQLCRVHCRQRNDSSSANDSVTTIASTPPDREERIRVGVPKQKTHHVFPWRHEEAPIPRVTPGTLDYTVKGQLISTTSMKPGNSTLNSYATAYMFLDLSWQELLFFGTWKTEFAESVSWAFCQGLAATISNVFNGRCLSVFVASMLDGILWRLTRTI